jgi:hypothetical protein
MAWTAAQLLTNLGTRSKSKLALHTIAKLPAELNPMREQFVQPGYGEQPFIGIGTGYAKIRGSMGAAGSIRLKRLRRGIGGLLSHRGPEN